MPIASHFPSVSFHRARRGIAVLVLAAVSPAFSWAAPADPAAPVAAATAPSAPAPVAVPAAEGSQLTAPPFDSEPLLSPASNNSARKRLRYGTSVPLCGELWFRNH